MHSSHPKAPTSFVFEDLMVPKIPDPSVPAPEPLKEPQLSDTPVDVPPSLDVPPPPKSLMAISSNSWPLPESVLSLGNSSDLTKPVTSSERSGETNLPAVTASPLPIIEPPPLDLPVIAAPLDLPVIAPPQLDLPVFAPISGLGRSRAPLVAPAPIFSSSVPRAVAAPILLPTVPRAVPVSVETPKPEHPTPFSSAPVASSEVSPLAPRSTPGTVSFVGTSGLSSASGRASDLSFPSGSASSYSSAGAVPNRSPASGNSSGSLPFSGASGLSLAPGVGTFGLPSISGGTTGLLGTPGPVPFSTVSSGPLPPMLTLGDFMSVLNNMAGSPGDTSFNFIPFFTPTIQRPGVMPELTSSTPIVCSFLPVMSQKRVASILSAEAQGFSSGVGAIQPSSFTQGVSVAPTAPVLAPPVPSALASLAPVFGAPKTASSLAEMPRDSSDASTPLLGSSSSGSSSKRPSKGTPIATGTPEPSSTSSDAGNEVILKRSRIASSGGGDPSRPYFFSGTTSSEAKTEVTETLVRTSRCSAISMYCDSEFDPLIIPSLHSLIGKYSLDSLKAMLGEIGSYSFS